jgi:predicted dehydrogenase
MTILGSSNALATVPKQRLGLVGTGIRGTTMWGQQLLAGYSDGVELVGLCDIDPRRIEASKRLIGVEAPTFTNLDHMLEQSSLIR